VNSDIVWIQLKYREVSLEGLIVIAAEVKRMCKHRLNADRHGIQLFSVPESSYALLITTHGTEEHAVPGMR
jgi:hypothetical protein